MAESYEGEWHRTFDAAGVRQEHFNGRMLLWLNGQLGRTYTSLPEAQQAYAMSREAYNWSSLGLSAATAGFSRFVDSVGGSDANNGLTAATAKQTIAGLGAITSGMRIGLKRGSYWREKLLGGGSVNSVIVGAYGSGRLPILDGADVITGWTKTGGRTNIYQKTITCENAAGFASLWEDGARLRWIADLDLLDANAGRMHVATVAGTSYTMYVHATGSGDPTSNGKTYEASVRLHGLHDGGGLAWSVSDIHTMRSLHNDGSLSLFGTGGVARRCLAEDGTKHNLLIGKDCWAYDCIMWKADWPDRTNATLGVAFPPDGEGAGHRAGFVRCIGVVPASVIATAKAMGGAIDFLYAHSTGTPAQDWAEIVYQDCAVSGANTAYGAADVALLTITRVYAEECDQFIYSRADAAAVTDPRLHSPSTATVQCSVSFDGDAITVDGFRAYVSVASAKGDFYATNSAIRRSVIVREAASAGYRFLIGPGGTPALTGTVVSEYNIISAGTTAEMAYSTNTAAGSSANNNVYSDGALDFAVGASSYTTFAAYRAAQPSFDASSVVGDPLLVSPATGNFNVSAGSPAIALGAGLARPNVTYTAIPSEAALAAM